MSENIVVIKPLQTERLSNGDRKLLRDLVVKFSDFKITIPKDSEIVEFDNFKITIPKNTETDYSTIPFLGRICVRWSKVDIAGVVHDYLYETATINDETITRRQADRVWREVALSGEHHANLCQAWAGWIALSLWGWRYWGK